jgi:hypothetical protein
MLKLEKIIKQKTTLFSFINKENVKLKFCESLWSMILLM